MLQRKYLWNAQAVESNALKDTALKAGTFSWIMSKIKNFESVSMDRIEDLPEEATVNGNGSRSTGAIIYQRAFGLRRDRFRHIGLESLRKEKTWSEDTLTLLTIIGEVS